MIYFKNLTSNENLLSFKFFKKIEMKMQDEEEQKLFIEFFSHYVELCHQRAIDIQQIKIPFIDLKQIKIKFE